MDNSVYIALSRQVALFRDMEVTANNLANVNSAGYNASRLLFDSYLVQDGHRDQMAFAANPATWRDDKQGSMRATGGMFDVAIGGPGYFAVQTPLGVRYTRAGNFQLDGNGTLITPQGYQVLDNGGAPITFTPDDREVKIGEAGNISVDGEERGFLGLYTFEHPQLLKRVGDVMFDAGDATPAPAVQPTTRVAHGMLESANVEPVREITHMIDVSRSVGSTAKFVEIVYDLQRKAASAWSSQSS